MRIILPITLSLILLFSISRVSLYSQEVDHYETIILPGSVCKYMIPASDIGHDWRLADFDDSTWLTGITGVGYGDDDDNTVVSGNISSIYIRNNFIVYDTTIHTLSPWPAASAFSVRVRPNPSNLSNTYLDIKSKVAHRVMTIEILDIRGVLVKHITDPKPEPGYNVYKLPDLSYLSKGIYLIRISDGERLLHVEKLLKQE